MFNLKTHARVLHSCRMQALSFTHPIPLWRRRKGERERERERDLGEAHSRVGCVLAAPTQPLRRHLPAGTTTAAAASVTGQGPWGHKQEE